MFINQSYLLRFYFVNNTVTFFLWEKQDGAFLQNFRPVCGYPPPD